MKVKITKLGHSCLLVKTPDRVGLFDPGVWSEAFDIDQIEHVDRLIITHAHPDHMDAAKIKQVVEKFPDVHIVCSQSVSKALNAAGISAVFRESTECTSPFESPHDPALPFLGVEVPENTAYHFKGVITHPGDNNSPTETMPILAMPFISPWGKSRDAVDACVRLKPKYVISIHDWHLSDAGRDWYDNAFKTTLAGVGIEYLAFGVGESVELEF